jgi:hypothetical protein
MAQHDLAADLDRTFAVAVARARRGTGMTAAEFDYSLAYGAPGGDERAVRALSNAIYDLATANLPEVTPGCDVAVVQARHDAHHALLDALRPHWDRMVAEAKAKSYTGWSRYSTTRVRFAGP